MNHWREQYTIHNCFFMWYTSKCRYLYMHLLYHHTMYKTLKVEFSLSWGTNWSVVNCFTIDISLRRQCYGEWWEIVMTSLERQVVTCKGWVTCVCSQKWSTKCLENVKCVWFKSYSTDEFKININYTMYKEIHIKLFCNLNLE